MTAEQRLAIWAAVNAIRQENGQNEVLAHDIHVFFAKFETAAIQFDASYSDAVISEGLINAVPSMSRAA
jgi:hypothetical protein